MKNRHIYNRSIAFGISRKALIALAIVATIPAAAMAGTVTVAGFSPTREHNIVIRAESVALAGHVGKISAKCGAEKIAIPPDDQAEPIAVLNKQIYRACPGRGLSVTIVTKPAPVK